jgi:hypothetical protein
MRQTPRRPRSRRQLARAAIVAVGVAVLGSLPFASTASASRNQIMTFDATGDLLRASPEQRHRILVDIASLGVKTLRVVVPWRFLAPNFDSSTKPAGFDASNPAAYPQSAWFGLDQIVSLWRGGGGTVLLTPSTPMPDWASASGNSDIANPKPAEFEQFVTALGRRYSGGFMGLPRVNAWAIGNELNIAIFILPHPSGRLYRELFLAGQRALRATGHGRDTILIGETAPSGGRIGTDPLAFLRQVLCLNSRYKRVGNCAPISATGWSTHPYNPKDPPFDRTPFHNILAMGNIARLTNALRKAARAGATRGRLPVYVTEFGTESKPDPVGVSLKQQAEFNAIAEYLAWRNPQIKAFNQYLMRDDTSGTFAFQTGLRKGGGGKKPAFDAFRMPLVAKRLGHRGHQRVLLWGVARLSDYAHGPYRVTIRVKGGGTLHVRTNRAGYYTLTVPFRRGRQYQASARAAGRTFTGALVRTYKFR